MSEQPKVHWTAEENGNYNPPWVLRYDPTPGGIRNEDGTTTHQVTFPALQITDWVAEKEKAAQGLARQLNAFPAVLDALKDFVTEIRAYQSPECEECEIIGPLLRAADAAIALAEGR
ncbi:hypothetical protein [Chelativorans sp. AA-79]|uniref:hypothetical protein n=1 Tax=Chelativorans sp. AA-79 TaxID=3028735 RepID=UPI0023F9D76B|nr:hypothetical protein [Chelativorans sp. AA-79]WEX10308.1 hypothetical protein PVE73_04940 [Chelativorans sp. AA-79]